MWSYLSPTNPGQQVTGCQPQGPDNGGIEFCGVLPGCTEPHGDEELTGYSQHYHHTLTCFSIILHYCYIEPVILC